jgi:hypothetical protein
VMKMGERVAFAVGRKRRRTVHLRSLISQTCILPASSISIFILILLRKTCSLIRSADMTDIKRV